MPAQKKLVSIGEAAEVLGVSIDTVRRWDKKGILHSQRVDGKNRYFSIEELESHKLSKPLSIGEASEKLGISQSTLRRLEKKRVIKPSRGANGERVYDNKSLEKFLLSKYFSGQKKVQEKIHQPHYETEAGSGKISANEAAERLGVSADKLGLLEKQGIIHSVHSSAEIAQIKSRHEPTLSEEAAVVDAGIQQKLVSFTTFNQKVLRLAGGILLAYGFLVLVFVVSFAVVPLQTARFLGIVNVRTKPLLTQGNQGSQVLAAETGVVQGRSFPIQTILQPIGRFSLELVKSINPDSYAQVSKVAIIDPNDVLTLDTNGAIIPARPIVLPDSSLLQVGSAGLVANLNSQYLQGKVPGTAIGDIAIVEQVTTPTTASTSGLTNSNLSGGAGITNANLANSSVTVNTTGLLTGGGLVSLGGSLTLDCPTCGGGGEALPDQTGKNGKVLGTNGSTLSWIANSSQVAWGAVTGTITDQSDLQTALGLKVDSSSLGTLSLQNANAVSITGGSLSGLSGLTLTSGTLTMSGLNASSINTGANGLTFTSSNFNTTATGINGTAIGVTTPSTGAFTTLSSTGTSNIGQGTGVVTINSSGALDFTAVSASTWTLANVINSLNFDSNTLSLDALNNRVGIGTSSPGFGLSVVGNTSSGNIAAISNLDTTSSDSSSVLRLNMGTAEGTHESRFIQFYAGATSDSIGTGLGNIRINNHGVAYATGNADLAEWTEVVGSVAAGDIIASASTGNKKAETGDLPLGVVSDTAAFIGNEGGDLSGKAIVGFLGRVNTKVSTENGNIAIGDPISPSSVAGVGMKQTKAGPTVGKALAAYSSGGVSRIAVQVMTGLYDPDPLLTSSAFSVNGSGEILGQNSTVITRVGGYQRLITKDATISGTLAVNGDILTDLTGEGLALSSGVLTVSGLTISNFVSSNISQFTNNAGYISGISWGAITGTLSDQTDLQAALGAKADSSSLGTAAYTAASEYLSATSFTDSAVSGKLITGYVSGAGTVAATDTILQAIQKLNGNEIADYDAANFAAGTNYLTPTGSAASLTSFPIFNQNTTGTAAGLSVILSSTTGGSGINNAGTLTWGSGGTLGTAAYTAASAYATAAQGTLATNALPSASFTDSAVSGKLITGYVSGVGTVAATDSILQAIQKLNGNDATNANLTGVVTSVGNATSIANGAITNAMLANSAVANLSGTNTGDNATNSTYASDYRAANFVAGTNFLTPTGSAASLTSFPTFNQNTTGTAAGLSAILVSTSGGSGINNAGTLTWGAGGTLGTAAYTATSAYATAAQGTLAINALPSASFTDAAVSGKLITGYVSGAGTVAATDSLLQAIQKLNGNDATNANLTGVVTSVGNATAIANGVITNVMLANGAVANLSGTNTGDNSANSNYASDYRVANFVAGTNYLTPTGSAASLTSFPTFNQSTTGNALTATTATTGNALANTDAAGQSAITAINSATTGTIGIARLNSTVTTQGNIFNGISQLVKLDISGNLPAINGSALTGITGDQVLPTQTGNNGKVLGTNGTTVSWIANSASVAWGGITGALSDQNDLQTALNAKANSSSLGTLSTQNSNSVTITGGTLSGLTSVGATTFTGALTGNASTVTGFSPTSGKVLSISKTMTFTSSDDTGVYTLPTGTATLLATNGSAAGLTSFPTFNQSTTGTATNITGILGASSFPALTGDVTTTQGSLSTAVASGAITLAKMANMTTASFIGRNTAGSGTPEILSATTAKTILAIATGDVSGLGTISTQASNNVTLTGGTINGITIGGSTTGAGTFTTLTANTSITRGTDTITDFTGNGLTLSGGALTLLVPAATDALSSTTSNGSGLEILSGGIALLQGCADGQILKWTESSDTWSCQADNGGAGGGVGTIKEGGTSIVTSATAVNFAANDFVITDETGGQAGIAIDYANSHITRDNQTQTISGAWTFTNNLTLNAQNSLRLADSDSSNYVAFKAPATVNNNVIWTLPSADGTGCFKSDGGGNVSISTCGDTNIQTFTNVGANVWTKPSGALLVVVEAFGGGGGGGGGGSVVATTARTGGGAGGGGTFVTRTFTASDVATGGTETITIGAGGTGGPGGTNSVGTNGGLGGNTTFGANLTAYGGGGGRRGVNAGTASGGGGGGGAGQAGTTSASATGGVGGGPGGGAANGNSDGNGGGGGGTGAATPGKGGTSNLGGGGGGSSSTASTVGSNGGGSMRGGAGGGGGGSIAASGANVAGGAGGNVPALTGAAGGGGTAGTSGGGIGGTGASNSTGMGGDGGGGGGSQATAGSNGGAGGPGGAPSGGGGGGGAGSYSTTGTGGAGGVGARGEMRVWAYRGSGADLAEMYSTNDSSLESGDVVAIDSTLKAGVKKSNKAYDGNTLGIISTNPGLTIGDTDGEGVKPVLVALAGRVPVKVSLENGPISSGDLLTPSSTPGVAMKAVKAGLIVGQALTQYDGSQPAYIMAFIKSGYSNGLKLAQVPGISLSDQDVQKTSEQQTLAYLVSNRENLTQSDNISEVYTDRLTAALEVITPRLFANEITITGSSIFLGNVEFTLTPLFNKDTAGFAMIKQGDTEVNINFDKEYMVSPVVNTSPMWNTDQSTLDVMKQLGTYILPKQEYIIVNANTKGFSIILDKPAVTDLKFSWIALAVKDAKTVLSASTTAPTSTPSPTPMPTQTPEPSSSASPSMAPVVTETPSPVPTPSPSATPAEQTLMILSSELGYVRLREIPSIDGIELDQIPTGTALTYISIENGWYQVTYNNKMGWVSGTYVSNP